MSGTIFNIPGDTVNQARFRTNIIPVFLLLFFLLSTGSSYLVAQAGDDGRKEEKTYPWLNWLAAHQMFDGQWNPATFDRECDESHDCPPAKLEQSRRYIMGVTGMAVLAFLHHGKTHLSDTEASLPGGQVNYGEVVKKGLFWIREHQTEKGRFLNPGGARNLLNHALGTMAFITAYKMTGANVLKDYSQKAIDYITTIQRDDGTWPLSLKKDDQSDTVVTRWMYRNIQLADRAGLAVDVERAKPLRARLNVEKTVKRRKQKINTTPESWKPKEFRGIEKKELLSTSSSLRSSGYVDSKLGGRVMTTALLSIYYTSRKNFETNYLKDILPLQEPKPFLIHTPILRSHRIWSILQKRGPAVAKRNVRFFSPSSYVDLHYIHLFRSIRAFRTSNQKEAVKHLREAYEATDALPETLRRTQKKRVQHHPVIRESLDRLVQQLGGTSYSKRKKATNMLYDIRIYIRDWLNTRLSRIEDPEARSRLKQIIGK